MGLFTDFVRARSGNRYAQRLAGHADTLAQAGYDMQHMNPMDPVSLPRAVKEALVDAGLGTVIGLPTDLGAMAGEDLAGHAVGQIATRFGGNENMDNRAIQMAYALGGPGAALEQARREPSRGVFWPTGALSYALDPTFLLPLLVAPEAQAMNAPRH